MPAQLERKGGREEGGEEGGRRRGGRQEERKGETEGEVRRAERKETTVRDNGEGGGRDNRGGRELST